MTEPIQHNARWYRLKDRDTGEPTVWGFTIQGLKDSLKPGTEVRLNVTTKGGKESEHDAVVVWSDLSLFADGHYALCRRKNDPDLQADLDNDLAASNGNSSPPSGASLDSEVRRLLGRYGLKNVQEAIESVMRSTPDPQQGRTHPRPEVRAQAPPAPADVQEEPVNEFADDLPF